jgi:trans-2,3-dihydro-3-hydroxyanthranilate isomerase
LNPDPSHLQEATLRALRAQLFEGFVVPPLLQYLHYDVFTSEPLLGNQLAVFTDARGLDAALMQRIAREMNFSESTFILPAEGADTGARMRIFTPFVELPIAGHPTIGSTFALAHAGVIPAGAARFVFGLNIGPVPVDLDWDAGRLRFVWMTQPNPVFQTPVNDRAAVAAVLGLTTDDLAPDLPIQEVSCGVPYLLVPLRDAGTVDRAPCDATAWGRLGARVGSEAPLFVFARLDEGGPVTIHSRMFAPGLGITEDPATGSASGPLGAYLVEHRLVSGAAASRIVSRQGVAMGRASRIHIAIAGEPGAIREVKVGGAAVLVGRGELIPQSA